MAEKNRPLYILKYLLDNTDEDHPAIINDILAHLEGRGIHATRKTVAVDLAELQDSGFDVICNKSRQNKYFIGTRSLELAELKMIVDAIQAAKFISPTKSLALMAAQQESEAISGNMRWSYKKRMESGEFNCCAPAYGFNLVDGSLVVNETEAAVVRRIFSMYLQGYGKQTIANKLNEEGVPRRHGVKTWYAFGIDYMLNNERYINRLDYGKKYCHDSPSIEESVLQEAIMNAVLQTAKQNVEVLKTLKLHIGMGLSADTTEDNSLDLQIKIAEIEAEFQKMLKAIAADNVEAFDEEKAKALMDEKAKLQIQLDRIAGTKQKRENAKSRLDEIFVILEALANHPISYDDQLVRQILESVVVESKDRIKVVFIGGLEVTQTM